MLPAAVMTTPFECFSAWHELFVPCAMARGLHSFNSVHAVCEVDRCEDGASAYSKHCLAQSVHTY
jgi:hypothetical protein